MADNANPNGVADDDEALRIAIALSLGQDPAVAAKEPIDLTEDDDDDEVRILEPIRSAKPRKIAPAPPSTMDKKVDAKSYTTPISPPPKSTAGNQLVLPTSAPSSYSLMMGLDRKKMEEERLARAAMKRKADDAQLGGTGEDEGRPQQRVKMEGCHIPPTLSPDSEARIGDFCRRAQRVNGSTGGGGGRARNGSLPFPHGVVKRTWCYGMPRTGDDIKIEEVLQKDKLKMAILSSFQWDEEWMMSKIDITQTKMVLVAFAVDEKQV